MERHNGGGVASAVLSLKKAEPVMITKEHYNILRKEYEDLRKEYEDLRFTHTLDKNHNNIWRSNTINSGENHICEKPQDLLSRIINCSSNKGDIVLDLFAGSASTLMAAHKLQRNYIGIERDKKIYADAYKRLEAIKNQTSMFDEI